MKTTTECPACHGEGAIWYDAADSRGEHETREETCQDCRGEGEVPEDEEQAEMELDRDIGGALMDLLAKAKAKRIRVQGRGRRLEEEFAAKELIALAVAWLRGEVTNGQAAEALKVSRNNVGNSLMAIVRRAHMAGVVTVEANLR